MRLHACCTFIVVALGLNLALIGFAGRWFGPSPALLALVLSYPLWSWRRLEQTVNYLNNELATNKFKVGGRVVSMGDVSVPMFVLGTETDHVAPWKSVYKLVGLTHNELTFALTSGGHNAGVVSGPQHPRRRYRIARREAGAGHRAG